MLTSSSELPGFEPSGVVGGPNNPFSSRRSGVVAMSVSKWSGVVAMPASSESESSINEVWAES